MTGRTLFTANEVVDGTGGELVRAASLRGVESVSIDSRTCRPGSLFVALVGERTDGHFFLSQASERGSSLCLINRHFAEENRATIARLSQEGETGFVAVDDTLVALQNLARHHLRRCPGVTRIAITGSSGKTTTKELVGSILLRNASGTMNQGNLNSETGLPLSTFAVEPDHRYAVFELGISHPGEMDVLADIVRPDVAAITNIGTAHIGFFDSQAGIAAEKKRVFSRFDGTQSGFIFENEPFFDVLCEGVRGSIIPFGPHSTPGFTGSISLGIEGNRISFGNESVVLPLVGTHNLHNALCAVSIADHFRVPFSDVREGLEAARPLSGRGEIFKGRITVFADSYNANPEAFHKAVEFLNGLAWEGRKIVVAGSMKELGQESERAHVRVGELLAVSAADALYFYGQEAEASYLRCVGKKAVVQWTTAFGDLVDRVLNYVREGDLVLIKGSRELELERLVERLRGWESC